MARRSEVLEALRVPIVQAPLAGGPSTPELAAAVNRAGGLGYLAAGYLTPARMEEALALLRGEIARFGVNLFVPGAAPAEPGVVLAYAELLQAEAERAGVELGEPRFDDDSYSEKLDILLRDPVAVVSFTFGLPDSDVIAGLQSLGSEVWVTVTSPEEARAAEAAGADALTVQGVEAGGHRGVFVDDPSQTDLSLLAALQLIGAETELPLVAAGGIMSGAAVAAVLVAGAAAAQLGTALLLTEEAATAPVHRAAISSSAPTVLTRAFSGRLARGIGSRFHRAYAASAPHAYPEVNHLTAPLRAHGRAVGDPELVNLWAGQAHDLARPLPAEVLVRQLAEEARAALAAGAHRLARSDNV